MRGATQTLAQLRAARDRARTEYLAAARTVPRDTEERGRRWQEFCETNAAYELQAREAAR